MPEFHGGMSADQLRQFIERIERLEEEKRNISEDIKQVYAEAKSHGFESVNRHALRQFWAHDRNAALAVKEEMENAKLRLSRDENPQPQA